ncbi:MAG: exo-alpha-sialidase [Nitrospinota bacterium]|nr:exo-alpha-sialidase [Nitrospinota bacterium]
MVTRRAFFIIFVATIWALIGSTPALAVKSIAPSFYKWDNLHSPKEEGKPHGSSMVELEGGDILATWYAATEETNSEAQIFGAVWNKKKWAWGKPYVIIPRNYAKSVGNTALFKDDDGIIWLFFAAVRVGGWSGSNIDYTQSKDGGKTWTEGKTLVTSLGHLPRNRPIRLEKGRMLAPFFIDFWYETNMVGSYTMTIDHNEGRVLSTQTFHLDDHDAIQPTLVPLPDGRILMLARDKSDKFIRRSYSRDNGKTWEPMALTDTPNPGSAVDAIYVEKLGIVLMVYNHSHKASNPLTLAFSLDGGLEFTRIVNLAGDRWSNLVAYNYPTIMQTSDGYFHVLWSHKNRASLKHAIFNMKWLEDSVKNALEKKEAAKGKPSPVLD